jgi:dTDP-4-dehydrorhamnose 3,5-epimerase
MSEFYVPGAGATIRWNDSLFNIKWPFEPIVISEKDKNQPDFYSSKF